MTIRLQKKWFPPIHPLSATAYSALRTTCCWGALPTGLRWSSGENPDNVPVHSRANAESEATIRARTLRKCRVGRQADVHCPVALWGNNAHTEKNLGAGVQGSVPRRIGLHWHSEGGFTGCVSRGSDWRTGHIFHNSFIHSSNYNNAEHILPASTGGKYSMR